MYRDSPENEAYPVSRSPDEFLRVALGLANHFIDVIPEFAALRIGLWIGFRVYRV